MKTEEIWKFIKNNNNFFNKISKKEDVDIDYNRESYLMNGVWRADPVYLLLFIFRIKFNTLGPSSDHELVRMRKMTKAAGIDFPFGKKEYDEYIDFDSRNQSILYAIEDILKAQNYQFIIPTKEFANKTFRNVSGSIEAILKDVFIYNGKTARYYVDIFDRLTGFEIFLDNGSIFVPVVYKEVERSALYEDLLRKSPENSTINIKEILGIDNTIMSDNTVFVSSDHPESVKNIAKYFRSFNIDSDDDFFCLDVVKSLYLLTSNDIVILINGQDLVEFISTLTIKTFLEDTSLSLPYVIDIAKYVSSFPSSSKDLYLQSISSDLRDDVVSVLKPYIYGDNSDHDMIILDMIENENVELCSRTLKMNNESSGIVIYNKRLKFFKEFSIERSSIANELIPDMGGIRMIASRCSISSDMVPSGYSSIDTYIISMVLKSIQRIVGTLPITGRTYSSGVNIVGNTSFYAHTGGVYGLKGKHSILGNLITGGSISPNIPNVKLTKKAANDSLAKIINTCKEYITHDNDEFKYFGALLVSSLVSPLLMKSNKFTIGIVGANKYSMDGIIYSVFNGVFKNSRILNTDSDFVVGKAIDGSTSILVTERKKSISGFIDNTAAERYGTVTESRNRNLDMVISSVNTSPIVTFGDLEWIIDDTVIFNFTAKTFNSSEGRLLEYIDQSGGIASYVMANRKKLLKFEDDFITMAKKNMRSGKISNKNSYLDFFEKILPAMCLVEAVGYMSGKVYHDDMMSIFYNTNRIKNTIKVDRLILNMIDGNRKVEDKVFNSNFRSVQNGDTVFVDKIFHKSYSAHKNTDMFVFIFNGQSVYSKISKDNDISYIDFISAIKEQKGYLNYENAIRNWTLGGDRSKGPYTIYKEYELGEKDDFFALRIAKSSIL